MLRISTTESAENGPALRLEGQLAGPWIEELNHACEEILSTGRALTLDLGDVSLIDRPGLALLASLSRRAVVLVGCSPFHTEQLRQAAAIDHETTPTLP
jgi:ABC-type transporter Mla MlaB component